MGAFFSALGSLSGIVGLIGKAVDWLTSYFHDKGVADAQKTSDNLKQATDDLHEIDTAQKARNDAADAIATDPGGVRGADPGAAPVGPDNIS